MKPDLSTLQILPENQTDQTGVMVVLAPFAARTQMLALAARLARRGRLQVMDGGNRFNAYVVARFIRQESAEDFHETLNSIRVARAFTPYQMLALLEATPAGTCPTLVLDMLDTFYDESLPLPERRRLLERCGVHLRRLSTAAVVVVSVRPPPPLQTAGVAQPVSDPQGLIDILQEAADQVLTFEDLVPPPPPTLF